MRLWRRVRAHRHPPLPHRSLTPARPHLAAKENLWCYAEFHGVGVKGSKVEEILPYAWVTLSHAKTYADVFVALGVKPKDVEAVCEASADMIFHVEWAQGYMTGIDPLSRPFHIVVCELPRPSALWTRRFSATSMSSARPRTSAGRSGGSSSAPTATCSRDYIERVISFKTIHDPAEVARASAVVVPPEISNPPATPPVPPFPEHLHTWATAEMLNGYPHLHRILYGYEATAIKLGLVIKEQKILTGVVPDGSLKQGASLAQAAAISLYNAAAVTGDHLGGPMPISPALLSGGVAATFLTTINAIPPERVPEMRFFTAVASVRRPSSRHCTARHTLPCRARPHGPFRPGTTSIPSSSGSIRSSRPSPRPRAPRHKRSLARAPLAAPSARTSSTSRRPRR